MTTDTTTEITEGDWKTLATTEITHLTDEEKDYLPRAWDEWIARVKRDAAREALSGMAAAHAGAFMEEDRPTYRWEHNIAAQAADNYLQAHYPEETP